METHALSMTIQSPDGSRYDISERMDLGDLDELTESLEEELLLLTHGDMDLSLDDRDGFLEGLFSNAQPGDVWRVELDALRAKRRVKYERLFLGVLQVPFSIQIDRRDKVFQVQAFSFSKILEQTSAETISRSLSDNAFATIGAGSTTMTVDDTSQLRVDDELKVFDTENSQVFTVQSVTDSETMQVTPSSQHAFTNASVELGTPFFRHQSISTLADQLFAAAGITDFRLLAEAIEGTSPFSSPWQPDGLPAAQQIGGLAPEAPALVEMGCKVGSVNTGFTSDGPTEDWVNAGAASYIQDWTPYYETEPGTVNRNPTPDVGVHQLESNIAGPVFDGVGDRWWTYIKPGSGGQVWLQKNAIDQVQLGSTGITTSHVSYLEWHPGNNRIYLSSTGVIFGFPTSGDISAQWMLRYYAGGSLTTLYDSGLLVLPIPAPYPYGGPIRYLQRLGALAVKSAGAFGFNLSPIKLYKNDVIIGELEDSTGNIHVWSMREFDRYIAALYVQGEETRCRCWDNETLQVAADFKVADGDDVWMNYLTRVQITSDREALVGVVQSEVGAIPRPFIISTFYDGVIAYADFEGQSCAAALRDLAILTLSHLHVDRHGTGIIQSRGSVLGAFNEEPTELPDPDEWTHNPWAQDFYRTSAVITGKEPTGQREDIEALAGDTGDSANRLEISSQLIQTEGAAQAIGSAYSEFFSKERSVEEITLTDPGTIHHVLDLVRLQGQLYKVLEATYDAETGEQDLKLLQMKPTNKQLPQNVPTQKKLEL